MSSRETHAAHLRRLRAELGVSQEEMGRLLGVSREWIGKLERAQEEFSEFVLMKMAAAEKEKQSGPASHVAETQEPYGSIDDIRRELRGRFEATLVEAGEDRDRLGWMSEQLRAHLTPPAHWSQPRPLLGRITPKTAKAPSHPSASDRSQSA